MLQGSKPCYHPKLGRGRQAANRGEPQLISVLLIAVLLITQPRFHACQLCLVLHSLPFLPGEDWGRKRGFLQEKASDVLLQLAVPQPCPRGCCREVTAGKGTFWGTRRSETNPGVMRDIDRAGQSQQSPSGRGARAGKTRCHLRASSCSCKARLLLLLLKICKGSWPR